MNISEDQLYEDMLKSGEVALYVQYGSKCYFPPQLESISLRSAFLLSPAMAASLGTKSWEVRVDGKARRTKLRTKDWQERKTKL